MEHIVRRCHCCGAETVGEALVNMPQELVESWGTATRFAGVGWLQIMFRLIYIFGTLLFGFCILIKIGILSNPTWWRITLAIVMIITVAYGLLELLLISDVKRFKAFAMDAAQFLRQNESAIAFERNEEFKVVCHSGIIAESNFLMRDDGNIRVRNGTWFALVPLDGQVRFSWGTAL